MKTLFGIATIILAIFLGFGGCCALINLTDKSN
jgi:hypothetical protein